MEPNRNFRNSPPDRNGDGGPVGPSDGGLVRGEEGVIINLPPFSRHEVRRMDDPPRGWEVGWWIDTAFKHNASEESILSVLRDPHSCNWIALTPFGDKWWAVGPYIDLLTLDLEVVFEESPDGRIGKVYHALPLNVETKRGV